MLLKDRTAIISGVGPGFGRAVSLALASEGASIAIGDLSEPYLSELTGELEALGAKVVARRTDIRSATDCRALAQAAHGDFGRIDILVNNGHVSRPQEPFDEADLGTWRLSMDVNYWGSLQMTQAVVPFMKQLGEGRIVMVNTMATALIRRGDGPYVGSKSALAAATRFLALDLAHHGIRVNGVHPGYMRQKKLDDLIERRAAERGLSARQIEMEITGALPLGYIPTSDEIAKTVVFLCSDMAGPITGQMIHVNAGQAMP